MSHRHFEGKLHAALYSKYRPCPPKQLIQRVVNFLTEKYGGSLDTAYDIGCGSGQSTGFFAPYFKKEKIKRKVYHSEKIDTPDNIIQLVTVSQAAHWFNLPAFYKEANRALCPNGVLAVYGYEFPYFVTGDEKKDDLLNQCLQHFYSSELRGHWDEFRKFVDNKYTDPRFDFGSDNSQVKRDYPAFRDYTREENYYEDIPSTIREVINYSSTWSGFQNFVKLKGEERGAEIQKKFEADLLKIMGTTDDASKAHFTQRTKYFLLLGRK